MDKDRSFKAFLKEFKYQDNDSEISEGVNQKLKLIKEKQFKYRTISITMMFLILIVECLRVVYVEPKDWINMSIFILGPLFFFSIYKESSYKNEYYKNIPQLQNNYQLYKLLCESDSLLKGFIKEFKNDERLPEYYKSSSYYLNLIESSNNPEKFIPEINKFIKRYLYDVNQDKNKIQAKCDDFLKTENILNLIDKENDSLPETVSYFSMPVFLVFIKIIAVIALCRVLIYVVSELIGHRV